MKKILVFCIAFILIFAAVALAEETAEYRDALYAFRYPASWSCDTADNGDIVLGSPGRDSAVLTFALISDLYVFTGDSEHDAPLAEDWIASYSGKNLALTGEYTPMKSGELRGIRALGSWRATGQEAVVLLLSGNRHLIGFVLVGDAVPDAILEIRYYSTYNFVGDRIEGYEEPVALLTREAAAALREVSDDLKARGYRLKIYDAYRPQIAVSHFMRWALDAEDTRMKTYFYPELEKDTLFPKGYIAEHSGHSRGSTVDLTLFDMTTEKEVDMGGTFDYFGELSHPDYTGITEEQYANRMLLREAMLAHGFKPLAEEWWHFTLENEPYPDTYFTFPVSRASVAP